VINGAFGLVNVGGGGVEPFETYRGELEKSVFSFPTLATLFKY